MKLNKQKVFALALAVCLIATLSMGSLAWFTDDDSVTNDFLIAGSDTENPDAVFSVDVWEIDPTTGEKEQDGLTYENILPGDILAKDVNVENTGAYDQYVRVTVTVSQAHVWQECHKQVYVPLNLIAPDLNTAAFETWSITYNADEDTLTYVLYGNEILNYEDGEDVINLFKTVAIPGAMDRYQAAEMAGGFQINVLAEAVQTENVGDTAPKAFETVGMAVESGEIMIMTTAAGLENALINDALTEVIVPAELANTTITLTKDIKNKIVDANGMSVYFVLKNKAENVTFTNIVDSDAAGIVTPSINASGATAGSSITVKDSYLISNGQNGKNTIQLGANCDVTVDNCTFVNDGNKSNAMYGYSSGNLTITNSTFEGFGKSWAVMINGTAFGGVEINGCTFTDCTAGIYKSSVLGGAGNNGLQNGDFTFTNNTLTNTSGHATADAMFSVKPTGTITIAGNTRDGAEWIPGEAQGIKPQA